MHTPNKQYTVTDVFVRKYCKWWTIKDLPSHTQKCGELKSAHHHPILPLLQFCSVWYVTYGLRYLMYPMGYCIVLPVVMCWYAVGMLYLTSVRHALNPTAGSNRKEWDKTTKLEYITISCK